MEQLIKLFPQKNGESLLTTSDGGHYRQAMYFLDTASPPIPIRNNGSSGAWPDLR